VFAAAGIHPNYLSEAAPGDMEKIAHLGSETEVVAIGETGLDAHWDQTSPARQRDGLGAHAALAVATGKPLIVHARRADDDVLAMLDRFPGLRGVRHCFDRPWDVAEAYLARGFSFSIGAAVCRPGYKKFKAALRRIPEDCILLETDCPYQLPPGRMRSRFSPTGSPAGRTPEHASRNEPAYLVDVARALAAVLDRPVDEVARLTTANAERLFGM
jgi:TatD DNase family protein